MPEARRNVANRRLAYKLLALTVVMFGFGYTLVPLYNVFCEVMGISGRTGRLSEAQAAAMTEDDSRLIKVEFVTNVNAGLPWQFKPPAHSIEVHPGVLTAVEYEVVNSAARKIIGQAIPSVAPSTAGRYFSKTECFCFTQQPLAAGETKKMPVRFIVDPKLPRDVETLTLGYTFFEAIPGAAPKNGTTSPSS